MNGNKTFIDTNIMVYAFAADDQAKREAALDAMGGQPVISTQVIREFSNVMIKRAGISLQTLRETIGEIVAISDVVLEDTELIIDSLDIHDRYKYSLYDSLIIAAALHEKCRVLLSEDMQDGQIIDRTLKIVNPFAISL